MTVASTVCTAFTRTHRRAADRLVRAAGGLLIASIMAIALVGCEDSETSPQARINKAGELYNEGNIQAAIIELKNALQDDPDNVAGRFMLGKIYVDIGDGASGEKELLLARDLGMELGSFLRPLGRAWLQQGQFNRVLDEIEHNPDASPSIQETQLLMRGYALFELGRFEEARSSFEAALAVNADSVDSLIGLAFTEMQTQNYEQAEAHLLRARDLAPENPLALKALGDLTYRLERFAESRDAYAQAVEVNPFGLQLRIGLARAQIAVGEIDTALENLDIVRERVPDHVFTNFLVALAQYQKQDYEAAKITAERVLELNNTHVPSYLIAGASGYALGQLEQANLYLSRFLEAHPDHDRARRLLGATQIRLGEAFDAMQTLTPLTEREGAQEDAELLGLVGTAAIRTGEVAAASRYFQMVVDQSPDDATARTRLAVTKIAMGQTEEGIAELQQAIEAEPQFTQAEYALMNVRLREGAFDEALDIARSLQEKTPDSATPWIAEGFGLLSLERDDEARAALQKALELEPGHIGAAYALAEIDLRRGNLEATIPVYQQILENNPGHMRTLLRLAAVARQLGRADEARQHLETAAEADPDALEPRVLLAQDLLSRGEARKAILLLNDVEDIHGNDARLLIPMIQANLTMGEFGLALRLAEKLVQNDPRSATAHFLMAEAYSGLNNGGKVLEHLELANGLDPDFTAARIALVRALVIAGRMDEAQARFAELANNSPDNPDVLALRGWLAQQMERPDQAVEALRAAYEKVPSRRNTVDLAVALWGDGAREEAIALLADWTSQYPEDTGAALELANFYVLADRDRLAVPHLERVLARQPRNWVAATNLATILMDEDTERALELAESAYSGNPDAPPVAITLGEALIRSGALPRAERLLGRVHEQYPDEPYAALLLAQVKLDTGKSDEAQALLNKLDPAGLSESNKTLHAQLTERL